MDSSGKNCVGEEFPLFSKMFRAHCFPPFDALGETTHEGLQGLGRWMLYTLGDSMAHPCLGGQKFM